MKSSCIEHPANEPLILIRQWQYDFCDGNTVAAALLSFFEYWHNIKVEIAERNRRIIEVANTHGETVEIDISLYQWHTTEDLAEALLGIARSKNTIKNALDLLVEKGAISIHDNPNPKYNLDRTRHFLFYPEVVNRWLSERSNLTFRYPDWSNLTNASVKNDPPSVKNDPPSVKNDRYPEITPETSPESFSPGIDFLTHVVNFNGKTSESTGPNPADQWMAYSDQFIRTFQAKAGRYPNDDEKNVMSDLAAETEADPGRWEDSLSECNLHWTGRGKWPITRAVEVYRAGGSWQSWQEQTYSKNGGHGNGRTKQPGGIQISPKRIEQQNKYCDRISNPKHFRL